MPVFTPGSTTTAWKPKYRTVISRTAAVMEGTDEQRATPLTSSSKLNPWNPRNSCTRRASSSEVRSAEVAMRQWSSRSRSAPEPSEGSPVSWP